MKENKKALDTLLNLLIDTEDYKTPYAQSVSDPEDLILPIIRKAAIQSAAISGFSQILPSWIGKISTLPEVYLILQIQARLIKDIAALYGREKDLNKELILYCLFKKNDVGLLEKSIKMTGLRVAIRSLGSNDFQKFLGLWDKNLEAKFRGKYLSKVFPVLGFLGMSTISFIDTRIVGFTAYSIFSRELHFKNT